MLFLKDYYGQMNNGKVAAVCLLLSVAFFVLTLLRVTNTKHSNLVIAANTFSTEEKSTTPQRIPDLSAYHLFGYSEEAKPLVAKESALPLTLIGIIITGEVPEVSAAIIKKAGQSEQILYVGDSIADATLVAVKEDKVILLRNKQHESLTLPKLP